MNRVVDKSAAINRKGCGVSGAMAKKVGMACSKYDRYGSDAIVQE